MSTNTLTNPGNLTLTGDLQVNGVINVGSKHPTGPTYGAGIGPGTGDGASLTTYNNEIRSWWGTGFKALNSNHVNAVIDHRTGNIITNGEITANGNLIIGGTGESALMSKGNVILAGKNQWLIHKPDNETRFRIVPNTIGASFAQNAWRWGKEFEIDNDGNVTVNGNLTINGKLIVNNYRHFQEFTCGIFTPNTNCYTVTHNLNIPFYLLDIRLYMYVEQNGSHWYLLNSETQNSLCFKDTDNNTFSINNNIGLRNPGFVSQKNGAAEGGGKKLRVYIF